MAVQYESELEDSAARAMASGNCQGNMGFAQWLPKYQTEERALALLKRAVVGGDLEIAELLHVNHMVTACGTTIMDSAAACPLSST